MTSESLAGSPIRKEIVSSFGSLSQLNDAEAAPAPPCLSHRLPRGGFVTASCIGTAARTNGELIGATGATVSTRGKNEDAGAVVAAIQAGMMEIE
jgi:hypothetical protein